MTNQNIHLEVAVAIVDGKPWGSVWAPYESAFLQIDTETAWDDDKDEWVEPDPEISALADSYLIDVLAFPARVIEIFRQWTGPNGWDINIMSDIAGLLVKGGWVDENDPIISQDEFLP